MIVTNFAEFLIQEAFFVDRTWGWVYHISVVFSIGERDSAGDRPGDAMRRTFSECESPRRQARFY